MTAIAVRGLSHQFGKGDRAIRALEDVELTIAPAEFVCLVGASGCGKSTLLSLLAGLAQPSTGEIHSGSARPAVVFQDNALFPWLTAAQNVELPLRLAGVRAADRARRAQEMLQIVGLHEATGRRPHQLSGGMRQRVALARALVNRPDILLMDEPFGALDAITRDRLHDELESIWAGAGLTIVFVTHDAREAVRLAGRVLVMSPRPGRIVYEVPVALPRPRAAGDPAVAAAVGQVLDRLQEATDDAA